MHDVNTLDLARIAQDFQIRKVQVESVVHLLEEGNTVPFITRYRKERTGGLNEEVIRQIQNRVAQLRQLLERKQTILRSIEGQGKLSEELRAAIVAAETPKRLEDLYLPYKPKKRTLAAVAREHGLEALAHAIRAADPAVANLDEVLTGMVNPEKELPTTAEVLAGVQHILAEEIAETADIRAAVRNILWDTGKLCTSKNESVQEPKGIEYKGYFQFSEALQHIPPHRILAINRGEKEGILKVRLEWDAAAARQALFDGVGGRPPLLPLAEHPHAAILRTAAEDALTRLLLPSLEREVRRELTDGAESHAVGVFARNLRSLLLQPPLHGKRVLAIDPGFRTGCKIAALDEQGNLLDHGVIFPHAPQKKAAEAKSKLEEVVRRHQVNVIAIGNGTACRESEELVSELIAELAANHGVLPAAPAPPAPAAVASAPPPVAAAEQPSAEPTVVAAQLVPEGAADLPVAAAVPAVEQVAVAAHAASSVADTAAVSAATAPSDTPAPQSEAAAAAPAPEAAAAAPAPEAAAAAPAPPPAEAAPAEPKEPLPPAAPELAYVIVNEAGASIYSASAVGREEFPDYDATLRGTISIGRRLQDPLSELVKIDPQNVGVGLYQHDVTPRRLKESLDAVIESSVNHVGVDLNTASVPLLRYVSGLNQLAARELVGYRKQHGPFRSREQLLQVPGIGPGRFVQAAGFLKIIGGDDPLDRTWIHPENYPVVRQLLAELGHSSEVLADPHKSEDLREKLKGLSPEEVSHRLSVGVATVRDILEALARPGRDPREDLPQPVFKKGILKLEDLRAGMELRGTVLNVVDFGAFVDVGLKDSGLVHISQMANRYIKSPYDVVAVSDVVTVWVLAVDHERRRVSLTMIKPGTERKPPEKKPQEPRGQRPHRPRGGRRPGPPPTAPAAAGQGTALPSAEGSPPPAAVAAAAPQRGPAAKPPPPRPAPGPRKPHRQPPRPKLSQEALEGKAPLRSFGELNAFLQAQERRPPAPPARPPENESAPPPP